MTGPTHKQFSATGAFFVAILMYKYGLTEVNYYIALIILIRISEYGARFPDVDHHWDSVKDKTIPNLIINKLIHITGGKHRSWQTHSIDILAISGLAAYIIPHYMVSVDKLSQVNFEVVNIILLGFIAGWASHIFSDMLNGVGVRMVCWSDKKIALVPKKIGKFRFNTGNEWEKFVYSAIRKLNIVAGLLSLLYPILLSEDFRLLVDRLINK